MHKASCADCGEKCKVPFRPTSDKPIYCNKCFKGDRKPSADDRGRNNMHSAICSDCGRKCEVPFRPSGDKPVYCSNCFQKDSSAPRKPARFNDKPDFSSKKQDEIIEKLDTILSLLQSTNDVKEVAVEKPKKKTVSAKKAVKKATSKKVASKKVTKKAAPKKATKKARAKKSPSKKKAK